tara:strand:+ start:317 stop:1099 length:783 start_codon:yes stop_codon:yes gene_type:complete
MSGDGQQSDDPSVFHEPHLRDGLFSADPSEHTAIPSHRLAEHGLDIDDQIDHSVWDEPGLSPELAGGVPEDALTYSDWLKLRTSETGFLASWGVTVLVILSAGPWALLGSLLSGGDDGSLFASLTLVIFGPLVEEIMKVATALWIVERRPFLFRSRLQILATCGCAALFFGIIENLVYLNVYIKDPADSLVHWRWSVCVFLHFGCTVIASCGLVKIWKHTMTELVRPVLSKGAYLMVTAIVIHGTYNGFCIAFEMTGHKF